MIPLSFSLRRREVRPFMAAAAGLWLATLAAPAALHAQAPALARNSGKEYVLAHASSFNAPPASARNPFWPIGWVPTAAVPVAAAVVAPVPTVKAEDFNVTTISVDFPPLAVINGKTRGVGDQIPVGTDGRNFVTVKQILDGVVVLDFRGHELRATNGGGLRRTTPAK